MPQTKRDRPRRGRPGLDTKQAARVMRALKALLREHDGNHAAVARVLGISQSAVHQLAHGRNAPSLSTAMLVANARGIDWTALLSGSA